MLYYVGGDGQEGDKGQFLPVPLEVGVSNGANPVAGVLVWFKVTSGFVSATKGGPALTGAMPTNANGIARVFWQLGADPIQQAEAVLNDTSGNPWGSPVGTLPVHFNAASAPRPTRPAAWSLKTSCCSAQRKPYRSTILSLQTIWPRASPSPATARSILKHSVPARDPAARP